MMSQKRKKVFYSKEIYRIDSVFSKYNVCTVVASYLLLTLLIFIAISKACEHMPKDLASVVVPVVLLTYITFCIVLRRIFCRGNPLVFTKAGVYLKPFICEYWEDICGYSFKKYDGLFRTTFANRGTGITVVIFNKGNFQRTTNLRGHSFTATNGIFFGPDKIEEIEKVFKEHGISGRILSDEI